MPSPNAIARPPSNPRFQLSTVNSRLFSSNSFRFTYFRKNASATPLESHSFKTKDLKPFRFTYFQESGGGRGPVCVLRPSPLMSDRPPVRAFAPQVTEQQPRVTRH